MAETKTIEFHFSGGEVIRIETTEPEEIIQMVANQKDGWLQYDDIVINVRNVSYIKVKEIA
ncbi:MULTISPECIES: hypothetical protein [Brevibacillus]|jgi:hypothetical protein|uniref:Uncharacterized protein n=1 Tax=Brevibacillus parabrevis TaxID=54914 RepID=A0A4Y3PUS4_BREPA|nr:MULTISPECIES: hypothetical protein [Brevibacillus]TGU86624.1 hypothetical protein EN829_061965 [Mesorhizobium sp. M00.F.Ca.ET.186.01.1.1]MBU8712532.1 hypothetical protein [Brevibacillus parabrevis]MDH6353473.1 hypothetical protein [Brevibacillus sp. 1238]MDR5000149.1 hypothetical protein [Brevibacillus parabrevis]MED1721178.1 hypothetical protein [Brevibacillus parabrevis]